MQMKPKGFCGNVRVVNQYQDLGMAVVRVSL
jgi:hypothetical protein